MLGPLLDGPRAARQLSGFMRQVGLEVRLSSVLTVMGRVARPPEKTSHYLIAWSLFMVRVQIPQEAVPDVSRNWAE